MLSTARNFLRGSPVTLHQFTRAAQKGGRDDFFVVKGKQVVHQSKGTHLDDESRTLNRRTWEAFETALRSAFSAPRFENTVNRYNINFELNKDKGLPLTRRYLEAAGIAASCPYVFQYQEHLGRHKIRDQPVSVLQDLNMAMTHHGYLGKDVPDPEEISGGPQKVIEYISQDYQTMDQRRCRLYEGVENMPSKDPNIGRLHRYYSRLTMGIISLLETKKEERDVGVIIPAPGARKGEIDFYKVYDIVCYGGLTAVALVPLSNDSTLSPILSFRCTKQSFGQADSVESMLNDIEENIGESGYKMSKHVLDKLMKDPEFLRGKKPIVTDYSLGGAHATYFMRDHWREVAECVCFNWVGSDEEGPMQIAKEINALPENQAPPPIYGYRNKGDHANYVGKKHLGWGITHPKAIVQVIEFDIDDLPKPDEENIFHPTEVMKWLNIHAVRPLDCKRPYKYRIYRGKECNDILDTYRRNGSIEDKRKKWGVSLLHKVISGIYQTLDFFFRLFGIQYFRKNLQ